MAINKESDSELLLAFHKKTIKTNTFQYISNWLASSYPWNKKVQMNMLVLFKELYKESNVPTKWWK